MTPYKVWIVEDEEIIRSLVMRVLQSAGIPAEPFPSAEAFLESYKPGESGCLLLDVTLPAMSGLELQRVLKARNADIPIVFLSGTDTASAATEGLRAGALNYISKPFRPESLISGLEEAFNVQRDRELIRKDWRELDQLIDSLTTREREVLEHLMEGEANKVIAHQMGTSHRTVEVHRARIMKKMKVRSLPELVRMVMRWRDAPAEIASVRNLNQDRIAVAARLDG